MSVDYEGIKMQLKHIYFINGTAYAGKSTVCKMLADKYNMFHCEENYNLGNFIDMTTRDTHPNIHYFRTMESWEEFITRDKHTYVKWLDDVTIETTDLEISFLLSLPKGRKVIVDTNIPHNVLSQISDRSRVAYMVTTSEISRDEFFNRIDKDKQFVLDVIKNTKQPIENLKNFKEMLLHANRKEVIERFTKSGFFFTERKEIDEEINDKFNSIENHFGLK